MDSHSERFLEIVNDARTRINEVDVRHLKSKLDEDATFLLIDVREESEFAAGHIPRALHLGKGIIERDIEKLVPDLQTQMILYCGGGYRSALAADNLQKMGYRDVHSMDGGYRGWREAGHPVIHE